MNTLETILLAAAVLCGVVLAAWVTHFLSYRWIKGRTLRERAWDYNICCGTTDGGGINADIVRHADVPRFEQITDVTRLPHPDGRFEHILCSHTIEHVPDPKAMYRELRRIGHHVTLLVPPLWDFTAALNPWEHQVIFLTFRSRHDNSLPPYMRYLPARWLQARQGQRIEAQGLWTHGSRLRVAADYAVPVLFALAGTLCALGFAAGLGAMAAGGGALWLSKRQPAA